MMADRNVTLRMISLILTAVGMLSIAILGYADVRGKANHNKEDITKIDKKFEKIEVKMEEFSKEQTALMVQNAEIKGQNAQILEMVKFLKKKAE